MKEYSFAYGKGAVCVPLDEHQVLGVLHGKEVAPLPDIRKALWESLEDPIELRLRGYELTLRLDDAREIALEAPDGEAK